MACATRQASTTATTTAPSSSLSLANIEATWKSLDEAGKKVMREQLELSVKADWHNLSMEQKRAAYYIAFGPHGLREPLLKPGHTRKVLIGISAVVLVSVSFFSFLRAFTPEKPRTMTREWQEATNEYLRSQNANPISGISSEGYKGSGFVHFPRRD